MTPLPSNPVDIGAPNNGTGTTPQTIPPLPTKGAVYLVGAGPGDPKLITVAGVEALQLADIVVYDRLANPILLDHVPLSAERVFAGKTADGHTMTQDEINSTLAEHALAGRTVVRLKGGDPFVFGRGGEEAEYLRSREISYIVVPGITSAIAAPAYAGIPVTHRNASSSFAVITGHERDDLGESGTRDAGEAEQRRDWSKIANSADTLIFLMGVESIEEIAGRLIANGRSADTPVAMIRWGSWIGRQETLVGTLGEIPQKVEEAEFKAPAVIVVGDVVNWREKIRWWDTKPLFGKRIVITRAREQASAMLEQLAALGAETIEFPTIKVVAPKDDFAGLDTALKRLNSYQWIVITSVNGVDGLFERLIAMGKDARALARVKIAAVGPATAQRLAAHGIIADFIPSKFTGEDVAREFPADIARQRVLIPRASEGNESLPSILEQRGATVDVAAAYDTVQNVGNIDEVRRRLEEKTVDAVTFTSASTVKNFAAAFGPIPPPLIGVTLACIGPSTAQAAREIFQREPDLMASAFTIPGLVDALLKYYK